MADPTNDSNNDAGDDTGIAPDREATTGTPRWVKVFGLIAFVVILLFVILMFVRGPGGRHGPGRHMGSADAPDDTNAISIVMEYHTRSEDNLGAHTPPEAFL